MSYPGDNEPEYIDDDDYIDPDGFSGSGRRGSNVLGGSGSRDAYAQPSDDGPRAGNTTDDESSGRDAATFRANRPPKKGGGKRGPSASAKARNPAPSVASSEERRARLAGKKTGLTDRDSSRGVSKEEPVPKDDKSGGRGRLGGLRARFTRDDRSAESKRGSVTQGKSSRFSNMTGGISGRISSLRGRFGDSEGRDHESTDRSRQRSSDSGGRSAFGRGNKDGRRSDVKPGAQSAGGHRPAKPEAVRGTRPSKTPKIESSDWLDLDRKLDLIGVGLVFGAIVLFFSALSAEQAAISAVNRVIGQLLGWGAFAVPITMFAIGMWLVIRHFGDQAPTIDPVRLTGIALAFLGVLVLFQYFESFNYAETIRRFDICQNPTNPSCVDLLVQGSYQSGRGGGVIGGWLYSALVNNLTEVGGFVIVIMVLTFGAMMITRSSMAELAVVAIGMGRSLRTRMGQYFTRRRAARLQAQQQMTLAQQEANVRVTKPQAARLTGVTQDARALPEPSAETMPIPVRLRELLGLRAKASAELESESIPLVANATRENGSPNLGILGRFFGRNKSAAAESPPSPQHLTPISADSTSTGSLERFLNLGDNLPFSTTEAPAWQKTARPKSAHLPSAPPHPKSYLHAAPPAPAMPEKIDHEPPPLPAHPADPSSDISPLVSDKTAETPAELTDLPESAPPSVVRPIKTVDEPDNDDFVTEVEHEPTMPEEESQPETETPAPEPVTSEQNEEPSLPAAKEPPAAVSSGRMGAHHQRIDWVLPDFRELLNSGSAGELDREPLLRQAQIIEDTLASFGAPGRVIEINSGPVITQYGVEPAYLTARTGKKNRVKVGAIAKLDKDLQLALGARSIRVEAPVPGKGYVGIEVPNPDSALVGLRDVMESSNYQKIDSPLAIALGVSVDGTPISGDLTQMPHLLIAGTTGSGKSVCVNAIINSIIANNSPEDVKFIMVDPKRVELTGYNGLPHLVAPVVVELERIVGVLRWVTTEMDTRYKKFSQAGARNIIDYNSILDPDLAPMPYIVVIIDELADLMMMAPDDTERAITRIAALARATGIHLVIATQRPSVDVVTGLIKANFPARIAFAVAGSVDSRVILDQPGAERLLGKGDMLYLSADSPAPLRMQGVHVSSEEINRIIRYWKMQSAGIDGIDPIPLPALPSSSTRPGNDHARNGDEQFKQGSEQTAFWDMSSQRDMSGMAVEGKTGNPNPDEDDLYQTAVDMVRRLEKASISLLQRRLRIGYTRAARLVDMMEERGVVGPPKEGSSKPRDVLPE